MKNETVKTILITLAIILIIVLIRATILGMYMPDYEMMNEQEIIVNAVLILGLGTLVIILTLFSIVTGLVKE